MDQQNVSMVPQKYQKKKERLNIRWKDEMGKTAGKLAIQSPRQNCVEKISIRPLSNNGKIMIAFDDVKLEVENNLQMTLLQFPEDRQGRLVWVVA